VNIKIFIFFTEIALVINSRASDEKQLKQALSDTISVKE